MKTSAFEEQWNALVGKLNFSWSKSVPIVLQSEASECGLACLTMIAQYHGHNIELRELRQSMSASQQGVNLQELITNANSLGLNSRAVKVDLNELNKLALPAIVHWNFSHFVILEKCNNRKLKIIDPAFGARIVTRSKFSDCFTGIVLELSPSDNFHPRGKTKGLSLLDLTRLFRGIKRQLMLLFSLSIILQLIALTSPLYMQTVIDNVVTTQTQDMLVVLALGFTLLLVIESVTMGLREFAQLSFSNKFNLSLNQNVFAHLLRLPTQYFQRRHMGDIVSRFASLQFIRETITQGLITVILDGLLSILTLIVMLIYSVKLGLVVLAVVLFYCLCRCFLYVEVAKLNTQILHSEAASQSYFMQSIRAIKTIKLANSESQTMAIWLNKFIQNSNHRISLGQWNISFTLLNKVLFGLENILIVYIAATLVMDNEFSVGMLFAFMSFKHKFVSSSANLIDKWIEFKLVNVHLGRLEDIILSPIESENHLDIDNKTSNELSLAENNNHSMQDTQHSLIMAKMLTKSLEIDGKKTRASSLCIENLCYQYHPKQKPIFSNLNCQIPAGASIAITGASGCGKSSLLMCLLGLLEPNKGRIVISQQELTVSNRHRHKLAAVMQDDQLLNGSILDNICQFAEKVDLELAIKCARLASVEEDILQMTMQYQTLIGDMGDSLSGGQKQRILLARALYTQPNILLLDEATSHLDVSTERKICRNLKHLDMTIIMIAHRPHTIASCEKVYLLSSQGLTAVSYSNDNNRPSPME